MQPFKLTYLLMKCFFDNWPSSVLLLLLLLNHDLNVNYLGKFESFNSYSSSYSHSAFYLYVNITGTAVCRYLNRADFVIRLLPAIPVAFILFV